MDFTANSSRGQTNNPGAATQVLQAPVRRLNVKPNQLIKFFKTASDVIKIKNWIKVRKENNINVRDWWHHIENNTKLFKHGVCLSFHNFLFHMTMNVSTCKLITMKFKIIHLCFYLNSMASALMQACPCNQILVAESHVKESWQK